MNVHGKGSSWARKRQVICDQHHRDPHIETVLHSTRSVQKLHWVPFNFSSSCGVIMLYLYLSFCIILFWLSNNFIFLKLNVSSLLLCQIVTWVWFVNETLFTVYKEYLYICFWGRSTCILCFCSLCCIKLYSTLYFSLWWYVCLGFESGIRIFSQVEGCLSIWSHSWVTLTLKGCKGGRGFLLCRGGAARLAATQWLYKQGLEGARRGSGALHCALVDVFDGEAAPQHLDKNLPELSGGEVVEERVEYGAEVKEGVCHRVESDVAPEVGSGPAGLGHGSHH